MVRYVRFAQLHCPPGLLDGAIDKQSAQRKHLERSGDRAPGRFPYVKELWQDGHWKTAHRSKT